MSQTIQCAGSSLWAGASCGSGQELLPSGTALEAAVDNKRPLPPIVRESFVMPGPLSSGKPGGDAVSCWRPSWQDPATAESTLQLGAFRVRGEAFSFLTSAASRALFQALRARAKGREDWPCSPGAGRVAAPRCGLRKPRESFHSLASSRVRFQ